MIFVINDRMLGKMLFSSVVGMVSSSHNLDFVFIISFITCSSSSLLNWLNSGALAIDGW